MKTITINMMLCIIFMIVSHAVKAQSQQQIDNLNKLSIEMERDFAIRKAHAIRLADSLNIPVRMESDGQSAELMYFENGRPVFFTTFNAGGAILINNDRVYPGGAAGLNLTGSGQTLGIWDAGRVRLSHQEFGGRVTQIDGSPTNHFHATHVAGTMVAGGVDPAAKGMSYAANLHAYDWDFDNSEMASAAAGGLKVSQHSYGSITGWYYSAGNWYWFGDVNISTTEDYGFGFYSSLTRSWDIIAYNAPNYLIVKSAGNDRGEGPTPGTFHYYWNGSEWTGSTATRQIDGGANGYDCIPQRGNAKNILTVGAVTSGNAMSSFSSWGPTDDGRVKPDVVAKGVNVYSTLETSNSAYGSLNGTSMSGPMVSGSVGLLLQHQQNLHPGVNLLSSAVKGIIIHSADDNISGAPGPDYRFGWGLMNTEKAAQIMSQNKEASNIHLHQLTLTNGNQTTISVRANGGEPLRATLVWNDVPGTALSPSLNPSTLLLVNDLDLRILDAGNNSTFPYILNPANPAAAATTGDNFRDNVEMVHIASPIAGGIYIVRVSHKGTLSGGSQQFSLIITGNDPVSGVPKPQSLTAASAGSGQINVNWVKNADNNNVMLVWSANGVFGNPVNGNIYSSGQSIPGGGTVLYRGANTSFPHTGLNASTMYYYKAFSYNGSNQYSAGRTANAETECGTVSSLPFTENFNASTSLPTCWQIVDHIGNGQVWQFGAHASGLTGTTGNYAFLNSDAYGQSGNQNADLITPRLILTNYTNVTLSFTHYFLQYQNYSTATLYYSINDGVTWVQLQQWNNTTSNPAFFNQVIPAIAGQSQVRFKWNYTGVWGYWWDIDDVSVTGTSTIPVNQIITGISISSGQHCFNATQTLTTGGSGQQFDVASGSLVDLVAGQNIIMLPGTRIHNGANLHAWIAPGGPYCPVLASSFVVDESHEAEKAKDFIGIVGNSFFSIFPNPATEGFTLQLNAYEESEPVIVEIYNIMGTRLLNKELAFGNEHFFNLMDFSPGVFLIRVIQGKRMGVERIIKQN